MAPLPFSAGGLYRTKTYCSTCSLIFDKLCPKEGGSPATREPYPYSNPDAIAHPADPRPDQQALRRPGEIRAEFMGQVSWRAGIYQFHQFRTTLLSTCSRTSVRRRSRARWPSRGPVPPRQGSLSMR